VALTGTETFGTVVAGFVTDGDGNLSVIDTGTAHGVVPGFLTDDDGRLVVTTDDTDATWQEGFIRSPDGALVVAEDPADPVYTVVPGFLTNADGLLAVTNEPASPTWVDGFLATASGLAVTGLAGGAVWAGTYTESFTTDDGGWAVVSDDPTPASVSRHTALFDTTPASLKIEHNDSYDVTAFKGMTGPAGTYHLTLEGRYSGLTANDTIQYAVLGLDVDSLEVDRFESFTTTSSGSWTSVSLGPAPLVGASITQIVIVVAHSGAGFGDPDHYLIDTIQLEKTA
jgi:hypothetical protein